MAGAKVILPFKDKETGKIYRVGDKFEVKTKKRVEELQKLGYLGESAEEPQDLQKE